MIKRTTLPNFFFSITGKNFENIGTIGDLDPNPKSSVWFKNDKPSSETLNFYVWKKFGIFDFINSYKIPSNTHNEDYFSHIFLV